MAATKTSATKAAKGKARPPWRKANPKAKSGKPARKLSTEQKATAKARAKKAGRPYPNLVDNMAVAAKAGRKR